MSADSISQWARACIDADAIVGKPQGSYPATHDLRTTIATEALHEAYTGFCRQQNLHPATSFGMAFAEMFGPRKRLKAQPGSKQRPWGYAVPHGNKWQKKLDERLGIKK
jgi:hypothetical protein